MISLNGSVFNLFGLESSKPTNVLLQIIPPPKTSKSKIYVATPCAYLISALGIISIMAVKVRY